MRPDVSGAGSLHSVTDRQFGRMQEYFGSIPRHIKRPPEQVLLL